jgi:hypothetical protein
MNKKKNSKPRRSFWAQFKWPEMWKQSPSTGVHISYWWIMNKNYSGNLHSQWLRTIPSSVPISIAAIDQLPQTVLHHRHKFFLRTTSASYQTNSVNLKMMAVHSSEMSEHLTSTHCRNPKKTITWSQMLHNKFMGHSKSAKMYVILCAETFIGIASYTVTANH